MKIMIITAAGKSQRFNSGYSEPQLKCLYTDGRAECILSQLLRHGRDFDRIVLVGGYRFDQLKNFITKLPIDCDKMDLVENPHYEDYGTMYSLYLGLIRAERYQPTEILFCEGDLVVDGKSFSCIAQSKIDAIAVNRQAIRADRSVVLYKDINEQIHYLYDTGHCALYFPQPVKEIYNSAQIWKFTHPGDLFLLNRTLSIDEKIHTNLTLIEQYYQTVPNQRIDILTMDHWINCNIRQDYHLALEMGLL